ncbi:Melanoma-associated antigen 8 [Plecturocebus cupreus]
MLESVIKNYKDYFPGIFKCMQLVFGVDMKEVDTTGHSYVLVTSLRLSYDGLLGDDQSKPKADLHIMVLCMIIMKGNCTPEEVIWQALSVMELYAGREHNVYGKPRKLLT